MLQRKSNIELLRIVAMLLVVFLHANYYSLGSVKLEDIANHPVNSFLKALAEQLCVICVNVFVLISGWFKIRPSIKGAMSLLFQVAFFYVLVVLCLNLAGVTIPFNDIVKGLYVWSPYWFVVSYLILYAIAPILNVFIDTASPKMFVSVLASFFFCEFVLGWCVGVSDFNGGYSTLSFVALYLLAQFIRKYSHRLLSIGVGVNFLLYLLFSIIPVSIYCLTGYSFRTISYTSPFVISASVFFFLAFYKIRISSRVINYFACSAFSIYLVHLHPLIKQHFIYFMNKAHDTWGMYYVVFVFVFAVSLGILCVLLDKLRILLWNLLCRLFVERLVKCLRNTMEKIFSILIVPRV